MLDRLECAKWALRRAFLCSAVLMAALQMVPAQAQDDQIIPWGRLTLPEAPSAGSAKQVDQSDSLDLVTFRDNSFGAYSHALEAKKYTVILFETDLCVFCKNLAKNLADKDLAKYGDQVVVSVTDGDRDKGARQLEEALGVVRYPTMVVLKTNSDNIHVAGRIEGEVPVSEIDRVFSVALQDPITE